MGIENLHIPENVPRNNSLRFAKFMERCVKLMGWQVVGDYPNLRKTIIVFAPHSSNWDWFIGIICMWAMRLRIRYLIKNTVMIWPLSWLINLTGGLSVDRKNPAGLIEQLAQRFDENDQLHILITPEGTRRRVKKWKTGFLRLAYLTQIPITPIAIDYPSKTISISSTLNLKGEMEADMASIQNYFSKYSEKS